MKLVSVKENKKKIIGVIVLVLIVGSGLVYKGISDKKLKSATNQKKPVEVAAVEVVTASGTIKSSTKFEVTPTVTGKIKTVCFKEGDKVKAKDLMFEIDSKEADMNVTKLTNAVVQAKQQLNSDLEQIRNLKIIAPFSGQISNIIAKKGDIILQGAPAVTLADRSKLKLTVPFNGSQIDSLKTGIKAEVYLQNSNQVVDGIISYINPNSHSTDESGKLYNVEISIDNPGALKDGLKATAVIETASGKISSPVNGVLSYLNSMVLASNVATGKVLSIDLKEDQYVNKGDLLISLENAAISSVSDADNLKIQDLQAQLDYAVKQLEDYKIYAAMDGTISKQDIKVGETSKSGEVISIINDLEHMELVVSIDDTDIAKVKLGQVASVKVDALPETSTKPLELKVTKIPVEGNTVNGTTTYPVTLAIDKVAEVKSGMNANIEIKINK